MDTNKQEERNRLRTALLTKRRRYQRKMRIAGLPAAEVTVTHTNFRTPDLKRAPKP